jgi:hypothetical protein
VACLLCQVLLSLGSIALHRQRQSPAPSHANAKDAKQVAAAAGTDT